MFDLRMLKKRVNTFISDPTHENYMSIVQVAGQSYLPCSYPETGLRDFLCGPDSEEDPTWCDGCPLDIQIEGLIACMTYSILLHDRSIFDKYNSQIIVGMIKFLAIMELHSKPANT